MGHFAVHSVPVGRGTVALSPMPGRWGDYAQDLGIIRIWAPDLVISMTTHSEMLKEGAGRFGDDLQRGAIRWAHLPVEDFGAPSTEVDRVWSEVSASVAQILSRSGRVLVHCRGGCGRSGMIVLRLMVEHGEHPDAALTRLRAIRPCAVETDEQRAWAMQAAGTRTTD